MNVTNRLNGNVKFYNKTKQFGFIKPSDGSRDVFFHISELPEGMDDIAENKAVSFEMGNSKKGPCAVNIAA